MRYKVTALTPLLVGDGRELSPIDYMVWKDQVNVLDQNRIFKLLARGPRLDGYLAQLRRATKLDFASWGGFAQNFSQRRIPFESADLTGVWNAASSELLFIPTFAATQRGLYLPASALKGALRTGLVFSRWSASTIDRVATSIEGDRLPRRSGEIAEGSAQASQMRLFGLADSDPVATSACKIFLTRTASLDTRQAGQTQLVWKVAGRGSVLPARVSDSTPTFAEMAVPGTQFAGGFEERKFLREPEIAKALGWRSILDLSTLTAACNQYAAAQIELQVNYARTANLPSLAAEIDKLKGDLEQARGTDSACLLCLGWGNGFLSKAAFLDTSHESYRKILRAIPPIARSVRDNVPFPKTRRIVFANGQPSALPGWIKFELA
jgi:CRISPR-associated protein Csm5